MILNSPTISGSLTVTGNIIASGSITLSGSVASASFATSASNATNAISASYANNLTVAGTLTAQTLVVQTITSSVLYSSGSNVFGNNIANTQVMTGSVYITGSVGVGTNSPLALLHLSSSTSTAAYIHSTGTANYASLNLTNNTTGYGYDVGFGGSTSIAPNCFYIYGGATASVKLAVASNGNIGIGTVIPSASLEVSGSVFVGGNTSNSNYKFLVKRGTDRNMGIGLQGTDLSIEFVNDAISANVPTRIYANPLVLLGGNVGIGTNSPSGSFHVQATNSGIVFDTATAYTPRIKAAGALSDLQIESVGNGGHLYLSAPGTTSIITMSTNGSERLRITSASGSVLLGTTTNVLDVRLQVANTGAGSSWISGTFSGTGSTDKVVLGNLGGYTGASIGGHNSTLTGWAQLNINPGGGAVYAGTSRLDNISDERIKDNIQSISGCLDKVLQLNGKKFHLKDEPEDKIRYGFIAQEVQSHLSDFVIESTREYKDENIHIENLLTLENSGTAWAALLVEAIKELKSQNDALQSRIETLESK